MCTDLYRPVVIPDHYKCGANTCVLSGATNRYEYEPFVPGHLDVTPTHPCEPFVRGAKISCTNEKWDHGQMQDCLVVRCSFMRQDIINFLLLK
jgi:hypothetical protein